MEEIILIPGQLYKYNDELCQIITTAINMDTQEKVVVFQQLQGEYKVYVKLEKDFVLKYKLQQTNIKDENKDNTQNKNITKDLNNKSNITNKNNTKLKSKNNNNEINQDLIKFLDAESYSEKLQILISKHDNLNKHVLNSMAASLDMIIENDNKDEEDLFYDIKSFLMMKERYEIKRFR